MVKIIISYFIMPHTEKYFKIYRIDKEAKNWENYMTDFNTFVTFYKSTVDDFSSNPPQLFIQPPTLGIIHNEQQLGSGQPSALRLYDSSNNQLINLTVSDIKNNIKITIDNHQDIIFSCISGCSYIGKHIITFIFNFFDIDSWKLQPQNDISINLINELNENTVLNNSTTYGISFEGISDTILKLREPLSGLEFDISNDNIGDISSSDLSYSIYIENNNELYIKCKNDDVQYKNYYISSLNFNLYGIFDNSYTFLGPNNVYLHLAPATGYDISYNNTLDGSFNININSALLNNNNLIKLYTSGALIGILLPLGYSIQPNLGYYNINNLTYHTENLLTLDTSGVILGNLQI